MARAVLILLTIGLLVWLDVNSVAGWHSSQELWAPRYYWTNVLIWVLMALVSTTWAFVIRRIRLFSGLLLSLSTLFWILAASDSLVLLVNFQTCGPGGRLCLSHWNWYQRYVHLNSQEFWDDEHSPGESLDIALVGDSFTYGQGVRGKSLRFSDRLAQLTGQKVANFGRCGFGTNDELQVILPTLAKFRCKTVVVCYLANDIQDQLHLYRGAPDFTFWEKRWIVGSPTYNWMYWRFLRQRSQSGASERAFSSILANYTNPASLAIHDQQIVQLVEAIRKTGATPVVAILPFPHLFVQVQPEVRSFIYGHIEDTFRKSGAQVIRLQDLEAQFPPGQFEVNDMDGHPNPAVHEAIAQTLAKALR